MTPEDMDPRVKLALLQAAQKLGWKRGDLTGTVGFAFVTWADPSRKGFRAWTNQRATWFALAPAQPDLRVADAAEFPAEAHALAYALGIPRDMLTPETLDAALRVRS